MMRAHYLVADGENSPGFSYCRLEPTGWSRRVISHYWEIQAARCRTAVECALPDTSVELYFNLGPSGRHRFDGLTRAMAPRAAWATGPRARTLLIAKEVRDCSIVGIRLRSTMIRQVLGVPAYELGSAMVDLDQLLGRRVDEIRNRLSEAASTQSRLEVLERHLIQPALGTDDRAETRLLRALCGSLRPGTGRSIASLAQAFGLTHRRVIALFDQHVGLKPKIWHRVARLRRVMREAVRTPRRPWAQIAVACGYCDQAHMIHEFRRLTGITPVEYLARRTRVGDGFVPFQQQGGQRPTIPRRALPRA